MPMDYSPTHWPRGDVHPLIIRSSGLEERLPGLEFLVYRSLHDLNFHVCEKGIAAGLGGKTIARIK